MGDRGKSRGVNLFAFETSTRRLSVAKFGGIISRMALIGWITKSAFQQIDRVQKWP